MTQPSFEEQWWDIVHYLAAKLYRRTMEVTTGINWVAYRFQQAVYYRWARLCQDRVQSEPPVGDVCSDCGWTLTVRKVPGPGSSTTGWWEAKCKQCDLSAISKSPTMAVDRFRKLLLVRSIQLGGPDEERREANE